MFFKNLLINKLLLNKLNENICKQCLKRCLSLGLQPLRRYRANDLEMSQKFKSKRIPEQYLHFKDKKTVEKVAKHLSNDFTTDNAIIFESSPGSGLLTQQLLKSGAKKVRVFEDNQQFLDRLTIIQKSFPNCLQIINKQIINLPKLMNNPSDSYESDINLWFKDIAVSNWSSDPPIKLVAILSPTYTTLFLRFIIRQLVRKELFFSYGRTQLLVFISEKEHRYITAIPQKMYTKYRSITVIYNTLFDIETLESVPYKTFDICSERKIKQKDFEGTAKLVRLTPKLYLEDLDAHTLKDYLYFVTQTFMKRKQWIIPFLENWFPNCGPELIRRGIPVFKYFGDLKPEEVLDLFHYFHDRNDYKNSLYKSVLMKDNLFEDFIEDVTTTQDLKVTEEEEEEIYTKEREELSDNEI